MSLLEGYKASLKSLEVEESIDVFLHRPLGYLVALSLFRTPISPDLVTVGSVAMGIAAGVCILWPFPNHLLVAGLLVFVSIVLDCSDGQLARMRKTSSTFGRMIDGVGDSVVTAAVVLPWMYFMWARYEAQPLVGVCLVGLAVCAVITSSFHTSMYDHYKNVFLQMTREKHTDAESHVGALERRERQKATQPWWVRVAWVPYLFYTKGQADTVARFDPHSYVRVEELPAYSPERAAIYREHNLPVMRVWKSCMGFGFLMLGIAVFVALGLPEVFIGVRLVLCNAIFYLYLRPAQRRASRRAFHQMGFGNPDVVRCQEAIHE